MRGWSTREGLVTDAGWASAAGHLRGQLQRVGRGGEGCREPKANGLAGQPGQSGFRSRRGLATQAANSM